MSDSVMAEFMTLEQRIVCERIAFAVLRRFRGEALAEFVDAFYTWMTNGTIESLFHERRAELWFILHILIDFDIPEG